MILIIRIYAYLIIIVLWTLYFHQEGIRAVKMQVLYTNNDRKTFFIHKMIKLTIELCIHYAILNRVGCRGIYWCSPKDKK